ncbi:hypothetical protein LMIY3S_04695 [Labrys miyagiensis]
MRLHLALCCTALAAFVASASSASADVRVGVLRCNVSGGLGLIVTSSKQMSCVFRSNRGFSERYYGTIRKFGLDIGKTDRGSLVWGVFAPSQGRMRGALAGSYVGVGASASVGVGGGANALVGGFHRSFTLQPFSAQAQRGVDLAAGVASLDLVAGR